MRKTYERDIMSNIKKSMKIALVKTIPVMTGYLVLGIGFGMIMQSKGFNAFWAVGMSLFIYAGSMQYVAIDLLAEGTSILTMALTTLAVNARHLFYGISMIDRYKNKKFKPFLIFALNDETYSLVCSKDEEVENEYFFITLFDYLYWSGGTLIGALLAMVIPFNTEGVDFALTALFLTVFIEQWLSTKNHLYAIVGVGVSVICLLFFGSKNFLIPTMIAITLILLLIRRKENQILSE